MARQTFSRIADHKESALAAAGLLTLALLALALPAREAQAEDQPQSDFLTLTGTWRHIVPHPAYTFTVYETFTESGGSVLTSHGPGGPSAGIGTWRRVGPRQFLATYYQPVHKPASGGPFPFEPTETIKVRRHLTLSSDGLRLTGQIRLEVYDLAENLVLTGGGGTFTSTRLFSEGVPALSLQAVRAGEHGMDLLVKGLPGLQVEFERSSDLEHWQIWTNSMLGSDPLQLNDPEAQTKQFYRVKVH